MSSKHLSLEQWSLWNEEEFISYVKSQRWFRSKTKTFLRLKILDYSVQSEEDKVFLLIFIEIEYVDKTRETYFVPLIELNPEEAMDCHKAFTVVETCFQDAFQSKAFIEWFLVKITDNHSLPFRQGNLRIETEELLPILENNEIRQLNIEQSNTSIVINEKIILKIFRKREPIISPEQEILAFLNSRPNASFFAPKLLAGISHSFDDGSDSTLALIQEFIGNRGDAWSYTLTSLNELIQKFLSQKPSNYNLEKFCLENSENYFLKLERLGELTALMHKSLSADNFSLAFKPEKVTANDAQLWAHDYLNLLQRAFLALESRYLVGDIGIETSLVERLFDSSQEFVHKTRSIMDSLIESDICKTRYHGDYHLGQVLCVDDGFKIIDFEGEPLRKPEERKKKHIALKDVSGMLRSFDYAANKCLKDFSESEKQSEIAVLMNAWKSLAMKTFQDSYFELAMTESACFISQNRSFNEEILQFFQIEKAFYELNYEMNNRPDWISLPLRAIIDYSLV